MVKPYTTERQGLKSGILLDANEHYQQWVELDSAILTNLNRYPDNYTSELSLSLAVNYAPNFTTNQIVVTAGSIEAIDLVICTIKPKRIIINSPSYDVYKQRASVHNIEVVEIPFLENGQPDVNKIKSIVTESDLIVFINPNNPTGQLLESRELNEFITQSGCHVIIDEAYIEFAGMSNSKEDVVFVNPKLIILRTFSKAWGLAGVRLGYILTSPQLAETMVDHKSSYSVNAVAIHAGLQALEQKGNLALEIANIMINKEMLAKKLVSMGHKLHKTHANFILIEVKEPHTAHKYLNTAGVIVRKKPLTHNGPDMLRISIGSEEDNNMFLEAFKDIR